MLLGNEQGASRAHMMWYCHDDDDDDGGDGSSDDAERPSSCDHRHELRIVASVLIDIFVIIRVQNRLVATL